MIKRIFLLALSLTAFMSSVIAQAPNVSQDSLTHNTIDALKKLRKVQPGDFDSNTPMMLNPSITPIYDDNFMLIQEEDFMKIMMAGDYIPEPYIDSAKSVKAFVLRKATELEKERMNEMSVKMQTPLLSDSELIGKMAPPFSVTDISGKQYTLDNLKGKIIVMNFWFIECKPCVMEIPELNKIVDTYQDKEVVFLGFALNDKLKIESFLKKKPYAHNLIPDSKEVVEKFKVGSFPTHILIDKNAMISFVTSGYGPTTIADLTKTIELLLK